MFTRRSFRSVTLSTIIAAAITFVAAAHEPAPQPASRQMFTLSATGLPAEGQWKGTPIVADFNGDGHLDLAAQLRLGFGPHVWLGDGKGAWTEVKQALLFPDDTGSCGGGLQAADVNTDGHLDFVVADHCGGVYVFLADGKGAWQLAADRMNPASSKAPHLQGDTLNPFMGAETVGVADVNGDKHLDIVASGADQGGFAVYLGDGTGKGWKEVLEEDGLPSQQDPGGAIRDHGGWANELILRDINKDGHVDVVASYFLGPRVWKGNGKGKWENVSQGLPRPPVGGLFHRVDLADVNEDGRLDLVVANNVNGAEVHLQNADGSWQMAPDPLPTLRGGAQAVALADLDGDSHVDLLVGGSLTDGIGFSYGVFVLRGDGKGNFTQVASGFPENGQDLTWGFAVADLNADKRPDVVVTVGNAQSRKMKVPAAKEGEPPPAPRLPNLQVWLNTR
jgi:hypothetical protein